MLVRDLMTRDVVTIRLDETVGRIREIFEQSPFHHLIVVHDGRVEGVVSDRDLLKNISPFIGKTLMEREQDTNTLKRRAHQIMSRQAVLAYETMPAREAAVILLSERVTCLPVVNEKGHLVGIVSWRDLLPHCFGDDCGFERKSAPPITPPDAEAA